MSTPAKGETLEEIAEQIVNEWADAHQVTEVGPGTKARLVIAIHDALRNERWRCEKFAGDSYRRLDALNAEGSAPMRSVLKAIREGR